MVLSLRSARGCLRSRHIPHERGAILLLAPTAAAVKFDLLATPEQPACQKPIDQGLKTFWSLVERLHQAASEHQPRDPVEEIICRDLLGIGRWMLPALLDFAGPAEVGPTRTRCGDPASAADQQLPRLDQPRKRPYRSICGAIAIERICDGRDRVEAAPLEARLHLPERQDSYWLQRGLGAFVVDDAHAAALRKLESILGLEIAVQASEDLNREPAGNVAIVQDRLPVPAAEDEGPLLVVRADGQGVPWVRKAVPELDEPPGAVGRREHRRSSGSHRRGQGEKANQKPMAAVGAVSTIQPLVRTADDVIDEVMRKEARQRRPSPQNQRVRAELLGGKVAWFLGWAQETIRRHPQGIKPVSFLSEGERALQDRQSAYLAESTIWILDRFPVWERLWKVAWCFFEERTQKRQAHQWLEERLRRLLEGKVDSVMRGIRYQARHHGLKGQQRKTARDAADSFAWNRKRMKYDEYLAAGSPIGSGVVAGACRHRVKDRIERTGMRWLPSGAQAMLDLRATYLNGAWNDFWKFHVVREDQRLYGKMRRTG